MYFWECDRIYWSWEQLNAILIYIFLFDHCELCTVSGFSSLPKQLPWYNPPTLVQLELPGHLPHFDLLVLHWPLIKLLTLEASGTSLVVYWASVRMPNSLKNIFDYRNRVVIMLVFTFNIAISSTISTLFWQMVKIDRSIIRFKILMNEEMSEDIMIFL